jgi:hypothetical protein
VSHPWGSSMGGLVFHPKGSVFFPCGELNVCFCRFVQIGWEEGFLKRRGGRSFHPVSISLVSLLCFFERSLILSLSGLVLRNAVIIDTHIALSNGRFKQQALVAIITHVLAYNCVVPPAAHVKTRQHAYGSTLKCARMRVGASA